MRMTAKSVLLSASVAIAMLGCSSGFADTDVNGFSGHDINIADIPALAPALDNEAKSGGTLNAVKAIKVYTPIHKLPQPHFYRTYEWAQPPAVIHTTKRFRPPDKAVLFG